MSALAPIVAGSPATVSGGGIAPASGQGFVPAGGAAPAGGQQDAASGAASGAAGAPKEGAPPTRDELLAKLGGLLGQDFLTPFVAADGTIYAERATGAVSGGQVQLAFVPLGRIDPTSGKLQPSAEMAKLLQEREKEAGGQRVLVKIADQWVWQTIAKGEDGKPIVTEMRAASEAEVAAYQQEQAAAAAKQQKQTGIQDDAVFQRKMGEIAQGLGIFGSTGQLVAGLAAGPNPYSGKPQTSWVSGWILAQRLNGRAEGKLLPEWLSSGPVATAIEWGMQAYGMLDMGNDIRTLREYFGNVPKLPAVNPNAVQQLTASGRHAAVAGALNELGTGLRDGSLQVVQGSSNAAILNTKLGAAQLVTKADMHAAFNATDPVQDAGLKLRTGVNDGIHKGIGALGKLVQPAMMGATALGLASSLISLKRTVQTQGAKALVDTQQGRGLLLGAATSAAFLGMYLVPMALGATPVGAAVGAAINLAQNVLGGVQLVNSYGLFGGDGAASGGFLDNDALRAAFLIPPLTPIGAFAFWMKNKKKQAAAEEAKLKAAQQVAAERVKQQREMARLQLQSTGQVSGATKAADGSIRIGTSVPTDLKQFAAQLGSGALPPAASAAAASPAQPASGGEGDDSEGGASALEQQRQQLTMTARPMR
jgi:hypothetical protein